MAVPAPTPRKKRGEMGVAMEMRSQSLIILRLPLATAQPPRPPCALRRTVPTLTHPLQRTAITSSAAGEVLAHALWKDNRLRLLKKEMRSGKSRAMAATMRTVGRSTVRAAAPVPPAATFTPAAATATSPHLPPYPPQVTIMGAMLMGAEGDRHMRLKATQAVAAAAPTQISIGPVAAAATAAVLPAILAPIAVVAAAVIMMATLAATQKGTCGAATGAAPTAASARRPMRRRVEEVVGNRVALMLSPRPTVIPTARPMPHLSPTETAAGGPLLTATNA